YNAGILLRDAGDKNRALGVFRQLIDKYPKSELFRDATVAATDIYKNAGDSVGAADVLERAAARTSDPGEGANLIFEAATRARAANSPQTAELYEKFLRLAPPSDLRTTSARIYVARAYARQGRTAEAERLAREMISRSPMGGTAEEQQQVQLALAEAHLILGDASLRRFESVRLSEPLSATLKKKQQALEEALGYLRTAANFGFADVSLASFYKIGYAQLDFANAVIQAPHPRSLTAEQRDQYDVLLREQMRPYREGAEKAFRGTLQQAKSSGIENEWTSRARSALVEFGGEHAGAPPAAAPGGGSQAPVSGPPSTS
ncbi:MAG: tetratricopeptide repeat protein, partial [Candidatus Binatia bacterium]